MRPPDLTPPPIAPEVRAHLLPSKPLPAALAAAIGIELPRIVEALHERIAATPEIAHLLTPEIRKRVHQMQVAHWERLFHPGPDPQHGQRITRIAERHHAIGVDPRWFVLSYGFFLDEVAHIARQVFPPNTDRFHHGMGAVTQRLLHDLHLLIAVYDRLKAQALATAQARTDELLRAVLPGPVVDRLARGERRVADRVPACSVIFCDLLDFSDLSTRLPPEGLVDLLDALFSEMDTVVRAHGVEKIKTIGDAYMAAAGVLTPCADHADRAVACALALRDTAPRIGETFGLRLNARVGVSSGPVVAGVLGRERTHFDLWGDTVNLAARMESHGLPGQVHISDATARLVRWTHKLRPRGRIPVKGWGMLSTWLVEG